MPGFPLTRRDALAFLLRGFLPELRGGEEANRPVRLAISETMVGDVNINDARVAMLTWLKQMMKDLNVVIEVNSQVFETTQEIVNRARSGRLDAVSLNILEYRQVADFLDPSQVVSRAGIAGLDQYLLLVKRDSGYQQLGHLRGRRLEFLKAPKMCVAPAWLANILDDGHFGSIEQFFGSVTENPKVSRVVLSVFFGQSDACLTTKASFDTMCELNPQVAKDLRVIASSPPMTVSFYVFHKNFHTASREKFISILPALDKSPAGRQLAALFQFDRLEIRDGSCLTTALSVLETADRTRSRRGAGVRY